MTYVTKIENVLLQIGRVKVEVNAERPVTLPLFQWMEKAGFDLVQSKVCRPFAHFRDIGRLDETGCIRVRTLIRHVHEVHGRRTRVGVRARGIPRPSIDGGFKFVYTDVGTVRFIRKPQHMIPVRHVRLIELVQTTHGQVQRWVDSGAPFELVVSCRLGIHEEEEEEEEEERQRFVSI